MNVRDFLKVLAMMGTDAKRGEADPPRDVPRVGHVARRALAAYAPAASSTPARAALGLDVNTVG